MPRFALILPAAGGSTRFGGGTNKLLADLAGAPVLAHSLRAFLSRPDVAAVVIPTGLLLSGSQQPPIHPALAACVADPRVRICPGGDSRAASVRAGVLAVPGDIEWVAVHDAARPLVSQPLIDRTLAAAEEHGAAVPALAISLTVKQAAGPLPARVERTVPRQNLWAVQTPQIMRRDALLEAFDHCPLPLDQVTDDAQLIEVAGGGMWLVAGEECNLKITTPLDLRLAALLVGEQRPRT